MHPEIATFILKNFAAAGCSADNTSFFSFPTWYKYLEPKVVDNVCTPTFKFPDSIPLIGLAIVDILVRLAALVAIAFVIYGAFSYVTSQGVPDKIAKARDTIIGALIGVVVAVSAAGIINYLGTKLG